MRAGRTVQAAARQDTEALLKRHRNLRIVLSREIQTEHPDATLDRVRADEFHTRNGAQPVQKALGQRAVVRLHSGNSHLLQIVQRGLPAENTGQVGCARLEPIWKIRRDFLGVRYAACAAADQRLQRFCEVRPQQQRADALRAEQPLMTGHGQRAQSERSKVNRHMPCGLRGVERTVPDTLDACASSTRRVFSRSSDSI